MNLTWYIIYQGNITNIWRRLWSVCSEAATIKLLRSSALRLAMWVQPRESRTRFSLNLSSYSSSMEPQAAHGPRGSAGCPVTCNASACQAAGHLYTLCWIFWKIRVDIEIRSQRGFTFTICQWTAMTTDASWQEKRCLLLTPTTCNTIERWAWIQGQKVFCHPMLQWPR